MGLKRAPFSKHISWIIKKICTDSFSWILVVFSLCLFLFLFLFVCLFVCFTKLMDRFELRFRKIASFTEQITDKFVHNSVCAN